MSRAIPKVKQWRIRAENPIHVDGPHSFIVLAPTQWLAKLNFREAYGYGLIHSIGVLRKPYPLSMFPNGDLVIVDPQWPTLSRRIAANVDRATVQRIES